MLHHCKTNFRYLKLNVKLRLYFFVIVFLFSIVFLMVFTTMLNSNREYNQIIQSASQASGFSIDFKNDFDYKMYRIIIGSKSFYEGDPYEDIRHAQTIAAELKRTARTYDNQERAEGIEKFLKNLNKHVNKIEENLKETGHYDENINILENDIRMLTLLIQDTVLEYIYYETLEMEKVRADMEQQMLKTMEFGLIMLGIMVFGGFVTSLKISNSISKPIQQLSSITNQVARGDLSVRSEIKSGAEVKVLSDSLNIMIQKLSNLIDTVKIEQTNLRKAELKLLQAQINPHFLYNTLDTIIWLAEAGKSDEVVDMVGSLSRYFRSSLSNGNDVITLKEEEIHVRSYLQIQQLRYGDILEYEIKIPEEMGGYYIPKITLQPIVENALYHGIKNKRGKGKITIMGWIKQNRIILSVIDNGMGMGEERLQQIIHGINTHKLTKEKDFYGLYNVNERIRLYFGQEYGLKLNSTYGEGTKVDIIIPGIKESIA